MEEKSPSEKEKCEYLSDAGQCEAIDQGNALRTVRQESCANRLKDACCYTCSNRERCEIACDYLDEQAAAETEEDTKQLTLKYQKAIERVAILFAEGKISEQSYILSVKTLEQRINTVNQTATNLNLPQNPPAPEEQTKPP